MANGPFDRTIINVREKPLSTDINQAQSQLDRALRFFAEQLFSDSITGSPKNGFIGKGLQVGEDSPAGMSVVVRRGLGFQTDATLSVSAIDSIVGLDDLHDYKLLPLLNNHTFSVATAPISPNTRIDIIEVKASYLTQDPSTRGILNTVTGAFDPTSINKILSHLLDGRTGTVVSPASSTAPLSYKQGVAGNPGSLPSTTSGYIKIAEIAVGSDVTSITDSDITDSRPLVGTVSSTKTLYLPATVAESQTGGGGGGFYNTGLWGSTVSEVFEISYPISGFLKQGDKIISIDCYVNDNASAGETLDCSLLEQAVPGTTQTVISDVVASDNSGNDQTVSLTNISFNDNTNILEADKVYIVEIKQTTGAGEPALLQTHGVKIVFESA